MWRAETTYGDHFCGQSIISPFPFAEGGGAPFARELSSSIDQAFVA
jgi:hypothetical protein